MFPKENHTISFSEDIGDSFQQVIDSQPFIDSMSIKQSSRPNATGTSNYGYNVSMEREPMKKMITKMMEMMMTL